MQQLRLPQSRTWTKGGGRVIMNVQRQLEMSTTSESHYWCVHRVNQHSVSTHRTRHTASEQCLLHSE